MNSNGKLALVVTLSNPVSKTRVWRNIQVLHELGYRVVVASPYPASIEECETIFLSLPKRRLSVTYSFRRNLRGVASVLRHGTLAALSLLLPSRFLPAYAQSTSGVSKDIEQCLCDLKPDLILVEEIIFLPIAQSLRCSTSPRIIVDLRDFYWKNELVYKSLTLNPRSWYQFYFRWTHHLLTKKIYRRHLPLADTVITVSQGHARQLRELLSIEAHVIRSAARYCQNRSNTSRSIETIDLVYHGLAQADRSLDLLIAAVNNAKAAIRLHLYLIDPTNRLVEVLKERAGNRVFFHGPVPHDELIPHMSKYDIGVVFYPPLCSSTQHSLPNKFFEYIQSRLALISGPSPDMAELIVKFHIGIVTKDFTLKSLIDCLNDLDPSSVKDMKMSTDRAAKELCFENESSKLRSLLTGETQDFPSF